MKIEQIKTTNLRFAKYNPRTISEHDFNALKRSIKEFGLVEPIVIDESNEIIGGHMRVRAAMDLGIDTVPCVRVTGLSDHKKKALNLALNRISGEWDRQMLAELLTELEDEIDLTGFDSDEVTELMDEFGPGVEDVPMDEPENVKIRAKRGDIYQLGEHRLMCGDATSLDDVQKLMGGGHGSDGLY